MFPCSIKSDFSEYIMMKHEYLSFVLKWEHIDRVQECSTARKGVTTYDLQYVRVIFLSSVIVDTVDLWLEI